MTISSSVRKVGPFTGTGTVTVFTFDFKVFQRSDLYVVKADSDGIETVLVLNTDYTASLNSNQDSNPGGSITLASALASGYTMIISSTVGNLQPTDLTNQGGFYPSVITDALDRATIQIQQLQEQVDRSAKLPITNDTDAAQLTADIVLLANNKAELDVLYANINDIQTVAADLNEPVSEINTVAGSITNVNLVGNDIANVNTVAGNTTNINTVAGNTANVTTVAGISGNVTTVAGISANVTAVANNATNINAVNANKANIDAVAGNNTNITAVAGNATNINAVNANKTNIDTVAGKATEVTTVAGIAGNVTTVAGISANVTAVANNATNINAVAGNATNINAVNANKANIDTVAGINGNVTTVAGIASDVTTVAANVTAVTNFSSVYLGGKSSDPTLRNDGSALQAGDLYFNTAVDELRAYSGTQWVAGTAGTMAVQRFSGNASTVAFTLSTAPAGENNTQVYINGVYQQKDTYGVTGTTLTFSTAPPAGTDNIEVVSISTLALGQTTASLVSITDSGNYYTSGNVEGALQEAAQSSTTRFTPSGTGATSRSVQSKLREVVSVKDFGAVGDGSTNDTPSIQAALDYLFANNGNTLFFPDGVYYLQTSVIAKFDTFRSLRLVGTASAGFTGTRPGGSRITGANGLAALFLLTKTDPSTGGGYAFECEHIDFYGNSGQVVSAIKNVLGGYPMRPFVVRSCNFQGFQKALISDITSGTINDTGVCNASITDCNFQGNGVAVWGAGLGCWMDLAFQRNVCEQNSSGIVCTTGYFGGSFSVTDCLLEGQPDTIKINGGLLNGEISRNYFEANSGTLMSVQCSNSNSSMSVRDNFIIASGTAYVEFGTMTLNCDQDFKAAGVQLRVQYLNADSYVKNEGVIHSIDTASNSVCFKPWSVAMNSAVPSSITNGQFVPLSTTNLVQTPGGRLGYLNVNGLSGLFPYSQSVATGDWIVAIALCRNKSVNISQLALYIYNNASGYIGNSETSAGGGPAAVNEWYVAIRVVRASGPSTGTTYIRWGTNTDVEITDTYVYKLASPTLATEIPVFFPSPSDPFKYIDNVERLLGKTYSVTSTTSGVAIVDTGIYSNTANIGYDPAGVYDLYVRANQNAGGNSAMDVVTGNIIVGIGYTGSSFPYYIHYADVFNPAMGSTPKLTVSAVFWNGTSEASTNSSGSTNQIRVKVSGFQPGFENNGFVLRLVKRL